MKKTLALFTLFGMFGLFASAQTTQSDKGPFLRFGIGYAFPNAGNTDGDFDEYQSNTAVELHKYSFGAGGKIAVGAGYFVSKNIGFELAAAVGILPKKNAWSESYNSGGFTTTNRASVTEHMQTPLFLNPSIIIKTGGQHADIYARMGLTFGLSGKMVQKATTNIGMNTFSQETDYYFRNGMGFQGALGVNLPLAKNVSLFAELNGVSLSQYVRRSEIKELLVNGIDILYLQNVAFIETEYEMKTTIPDTSIAPPNMPSKRAAYSLPFSNIGFAGGLIIKF
jgi:hypothetical protein